MAFRDSDIAELFAEQTDGHNLGLRARLENKLSLTKHKNKTAQRTVAHAWCVVQCRLCASEHPSEQSLRGHWYKVHRPQHDQAVLVNKALQVAAARAQHPAYEARLVRRIALLEAQLNASRLELHRVRGIK